MKAENESVSDDEFVLRLVWGDYFKESLPLPIQPAAFEPKDSEPEGISVFRDSCLPSPADTLVVISPNKRNRYFLARLSVLDLRALGLTVRPDPIQAVPGHAVIPELNAVDCRTKKAFWRVVQKQLAELASRNIVYRPRS